MFRLEEGVGFPSASRALARKKVNFNDPNGYYIFLDLPPWASDREIRQRCRMLMAAYHPDGSEPNAAMYERTSMIYKVLRDPVQKAIYEHVAEGNVYVDDEVIRDSEEGKIVIEIDDKPKPKDSFWSYFSDDPQPSDRHLAGMWYQLLLEAAYDIGWAGRIRLYMTTSRVRNVVGEEVYVWKHNPTPDRAAAVMSTYATVRGFM